MQRQYRHGTPEAEPEPVRTALPAAAAPDDPEPAPDRLPAPPVPTTLVQMVTWAGENGLRCTEGWDDLEAVNDRRLALGLPMFERPGARRHA
jgi:hypothetical protein